MAEVHRTITAPSLLAGNPRELALRGVLQGHHHKVPVRWLEGISFSLIPVSRREPHLLEEERTASFRTGMARDPALLRGKV